MPEENVPFFGHQFRKCEPSATKFGVQ